MEQGAAVWRVLWEELHHQGDVGEASYAALPHLVRINAARPDRDWNLYALTATIEIERHRRANPPLPAWLAADYRQAWQQLVQLALSDLATDRDHLMLRAALSVIALGSQDLKLGALLSHADGDEISAYVEEHLSWSALYGQAR